MAPEKLSLWLVPCGEKARLLRKLMDPPPRSPTDAQLDPASYPSFDPHVTLMAPISSSPSSVASVKAMLTAWAHKKSGQGGPYVPFEQTRIGEHTVYIACRRTEELAEMHTMLLPEGEKEIKEFLRYPHLSLCYITDRDEGERKRFHDALFSTGKVKAATEEDGGSASEGWSWRGRRLDKRLQR
ncbi:hypothetical protein BKA70DRAFT_1416462 [Coprinopsis sp. MPI-PUGE-AT-0042]|nr:hypothetical protein BKA70DRAFT_1416462 [Coprinopsis sp. MPI-PUGE-AT-0042]